MAYTKPVARLTIDNPNADVTPNLFGFGRDWPAEEPNELVTRFTSDSDVLLGWHYDGQFEYLKPLKALAPLGQATFENLNIGEWTVESGDWDEAPRTGICPTTHLRFTDGTAGLYAGGDFGSIVCDGDVEPNLQFTVWRMPSGPDETDPNIFEVQLVGDGVIPTYGLVFPAPGLAGQWWTDRFTGTDRELRHPLLTGLPVGGGTWTLIDECMGGGAPEELSRIQTTARWQGLRIEYLDGWLVVRFSGTDEVWVYRKRWTDSLGVEHDFELRPGPIRVLYVGHTGQFNAAELAYSTDVTARPRGYVYAGAVFTQTPSYGLLKGDDPPDSTITVSADPAPPAYGSRPFVRFQGDGDHRGVLYDVQEYRAATHAAGVSSPVSSQGNDDLKLMAVSGSMDDTWRGATCDMTLEAPDGTLPEYKGNEKVKVEVSSDDGVGYDAQFFGYARGPTKELEGGRCGPRLQLAAADPIEVRMQKKDMGFSCSFGGWQIDAAFTHILNRCEFSNAQILIDARIPAGGMGALRNLPVGDPPSDLALKFDDQHNVVDALDQIVKTRGCNWGWNCTTGQFFLRWGPPVYDGTPDFTLDADTVTPEDIALQLGATRSPEDFANCIYVMVGQGMLASARALIDRASMTDATSDNFIGDDWWVKERIADGDADSLASRIAELERVHGQVARPIYFTLMDHPDLFPDMWIELELDDVDVPTGSIARFTRKTWSWDEATLFRQEFEAVITEVAA